jgi:ATP-dependent helicase/nuclease subunit A
MGYRAQGTSGADDTAKGDASSALPDWALQPIGPEPRPPRPLAPSAAGEDGAADPPLPPEVARIAARRGVLMHRLLERLPDIAAPDRAAKGQAWLARQGSDFDEGERGVMLDSALAVLDHPDFAELFSPLALAEVSLAATVDGVVVAGTVDRLLVTDDAVTVVDFKTTRRPPQRLDAVPLATIKQMAAYVAALETIYLGRRVRAAVLYTHGPILHELAPQTLVANKTNLGAPQQSYAQMNLDAY